jgi:hypothetical protein
MAALSADLEAVRLAVKAALQAVVGRVRRIAGELLAAGQRAAQHTR